MGRPVEVAVIGRGMIGSAAARHLTESGASVALIGPGEPRERRTHEGPFASHHDQARVTRVAADDPLWARMAAASLARYDDVARRSGIEFHVPCGLVVVPEDPDLWIRTSKANGGGATQVDADWLADRFGIVVTSERPVVHEPAPAGAINPLAHVAAQTELVRQAGGLVVDQAASSVDRRDGAWRVAGRFDEIAAARVLVATGGFGSELLPRRLELIRRPRTVVMAEMSASVGTRLPSLIHEGPLPGDLGGIYWTPPVPYPDGRRYLKIGGELLPGEQSEESELASWFRSDGDPREVAALTRVLHVVLPDTEFGAVWSKPCVVVFTPTGYPYLGWVDDGLAVALGGNGAAAKSSDEVGRLAASLFDDGGWDDTYDRDLFTPRFCEP